MNTNIPLNLPEKSPLPLEYAHELREAVNSPLNEWVTGELVGHSPTWEEKLVHFVANGGPADLKKRFLAKRNLVRATA